jgi:hypothetical protein
LFVSTDEKLGWLLLPELVLGDVVLDELPPPPTARPTTGWTTKRKNLPQRRRATGQKVPRRW